MTSRAQSKLHVRWPQVSAFRLMRHHLADRSAAGPVRVCGDVCGVQAQVMGAALMALWARNHRLTRADIHAALWTRRTLVKTSCMRGTLHLLPAAEFSIYIQALKQSRMRQMRQVMSRYGVKPQVADAVTQAAVEALRAGPMARRELTERILSRGIVRGRATRWFQSSWWGVVRQAIVEGRVCYGPDQGQEVTYVHADQWLPKQKELDELDAKKNLLRRYLRAYGPATQQDFARWTGLAMSEVHAAWESLKPELAEVSVEGRAGAILREDLDALRDAALEKPTLKLLPNFDAYLLGHREKDHLVERRRYEQVYRKAGWISPVVLSDGRVIGVWSHKRQGEKLYIAVRPFENFSRPIRRRIEEEAESLGRFLGARAQVQFCL